MGKVTGFLEYDRVENKVISPKTRVKNFKEWTAESRIGTTNVLLIILFLNGMS